MAFQKFVTLDQKFENLGEDLDRIIADLDYLIDTPKRKEQEARAEQAADWIIEEADRAGVSPYHILETSYPRLSPRFVSQIENSVPWVVRFGFGQRD